MKGLLRFAPFNVPMNFHWSALLLVVLLYFQVGLLGIALSAIIFASIIVHEYSHVYAAQRQGMYVDRVIIFALGAAALVEPGNSTPKEDLKVAIAGPMGSFALAALGLLPAIFVPNEITFYFLGINVILGVFNLLPLFPMDGGRVLNALLTMAIGPMKAIKASVITTYVLGTAGVAISVYFSQWWIAAVVAIVMLMAWQQKRLVESRARGSSPMF